MNKIDVLKQLKDLRDTCKEYNMIEVNEKDIEALSIAIDLLKETAPEVPVQEQQDNIYPSKITLVDAIGSGTYVSNGIIYDSSTALTIEVLIDRNIYNKKDVYKAIKKVYGKLLQYFC